MKILLLALAAALGLQPALGKEIHFYIGTYTNHTSSKGVYQGTLDTETGKLGPITLAASAVDPSFLAFDPGEKHVYVAEETPETGKIQAFARQSDDSLTSLGIRPGGGMGTCYISVDPRGKDALIANYSSGSVACFHLNPDGSLGRQTALVQLHGSGPNLDRQKSAHLHSIYVSPDEAFVYACDLGSDAVWIFKFDATAGTLLPGRPGFASVAPGSGARHLVFSADSKRVYVANEMGHSVTVFARDIGSGKLVRLQTLSTLSDDISPAKVTTAEIALHPSGKWLYVSNRGCDTIAVLSCGAESRLKPVQSMAAGVKMPRNFAIDPTGHWMIVAGQGNSRLAVLKIDPATGKLAATDQSAEVASPVCILFDKD